MQQVQCNWRGSTANIALSLQQDINMELQAEEKCGSTQNWSSDDAKIQDLATVMDSQDNPERIFQIYNFGKITSSRFDPWSAGKYKSEARFEEEMAEMCAYIISMFEDLIPSSDL